MITHHPSLITHHSIFITYHSSLKTPTPFGTITHLSSLNIFQLFVDPIPVPCAAFTFFFFFLQPPVPKLIEPSERRRRRRRRRNLETEPSGKKKKKKKEEEEEDRTQEKKGIKKKESKVKRCGCGSLHVCLITKMPLTYELWKLKTVKICFQFP